MICNAISKRSAFKILTIPEGYSQHNKLLLLFILISNLSNSSNWDYLKGKYCTILVAETY